MDGSPHSDSEAVYLPGQPLEEGHELQVDLECYHMLHSFEPEWPSLSFDVFRDRLGNDRSTFPHTVFLAAGSQAESAGKNRISLLKMSNLQKCSSAESDEEDDAEAVVDYISLPFYGSVNRIRALKSSEAQIVAAWSDAAHRVDILDVSNLFGQLESSVERLASERKVSAAFSVAHRVEGFALDWSSTFEGNLVSGDCSGCINFTCAGPDGFRTVNAFSAGNSSTEDLQWSPTETGVFAAGSADQCVRLFDCRAGPNAQMTQQVANCDVNVITWNTIVPYFLASGHDDGSFAVWDLRSFQSTGKCTSAASYSWHRQAVTSIEWHTHDESMLAVSGEDNQISIWDLATEKDDSAKENGVEVPEQLLFVHQGQEEIKELHWHPQIPGCIISTAATGFNLFKTINT